jgi:lysozyme family protein
MDASFDPSLAFTLSEEGGFNENPRDPRFTSNHGISLARLRRFLREPALSPDDIKRVPCITVRALYRADFWNRVRCDALPAGVDLMLFDHAVSAGPDRAGRALQRAVGAKWEAVDGAIGPDTLDPANLMDPLVLLEAVAAMQRASYRQMAAFGLFEETWLARLDRRRNAALALMAETEPLSRR